VLTQQQLADAAKLHRVTIARLEEGRQRPTAASVWKIARALRWPAFRVISAGLAGDNRGHSLGEEKASKALPSVVAWAGSVAAGGASCQAAARRLREVGDVVIVEDLRRASASKTCTRSASARGARARTSTTNPLAAIGRSASPTP
jgi:DNA-binding XRE family transcriptional regulator